MIDFVKNKINGINKRMRAYTYGLFYLFNSSFKIDNKLKINGKTKYFILDKVNIEEFVAICFTDIYKLSFLSKKLRRVSTIIDIGANHGIFAIAARQHFKNAKIICYEPNYNLEETLRHNVNLLNAEVYLEAACKNDGTVELELFDSDLATTVTATNEGNITSCSLSTILNRQQYICDILKIDCEGCEWELLTDMEAFKKVNSVTMEYHLFPENGQDYKSLVQLLNNIGFEIAFHTQLSKTQGIVIAISKRKK